MHLIRIMNCELISKGLEEARCCLENFIQDERTLPAIDAAARMMHSALKQGGKIITCGNGGSLCDATHFAEELTGRFRSSRRPLPAVAINDAAYLTCTANDFSFEDVFARYVEGVGKPGDVLICLSTSGESPNILRAAQAAKNGGLKTIALTSGSGTTLSRLCDWCSALSSRTKPCADREASLPSSPPPQTRTLCSAHLHIPSLTKEKG